MRIKRSWRDIIYDRNTTSIKNADDFVEACKRGECIAVSKFKYNYELLFRAVITTSVIYKCLDICVDNNYLSLYLYLFLNCDILYNNLRINILTEHIKTFFIKTWSTDFRQPNLIFKYGKEIKDIENKFKQLEWKPVTKKCYKNFHPSINIMRNLENVLNAANNVLIEVLLHKIYFLSYRCYDNNLVKKIHELDISDDNVLFHGIKDIHFSYNIMHIIYEQTGKSMTVKQVKDKIGPLSNRIKLLSVYLGMEDLSQYGFRSELN